MADGPLSRRQFGDNVTDLAAFRRTRHVSRPHPMDMSSAELARHIEVDHGVPLDDEMMGPALAEQMHADLHRAIGEHVPYIPHTHD